MYLLGTFGFDAAENEPSKIVIIQTSRYAAGRPLAIAGLFAADLHVRKLQRAAASHLLLSSEIAESGLARTLLAKFAATGGLTLALRWPYARRWRRPRPNCENPAKIRQNLGKIWAKSS